MAGVLRNRRHNVPPCCKKTSFETNEPIRWAREITRTQETNNFFSDQLNSHTPFFLPARATPDSASAFSTIRSLAHGKNQSSYISIPICPSIKKTPTPSAFHISSPVRPQLDRAHFRNPCPIHPSLQKVVLSCSQGKGEKNISRLV